MMKHWINLHPTRKSYSILSGKRSVEKLTNSLKIWLPRMSRGVEEKWFHQEDMNREKKGHGIFRMIQMTLMTARKNKSLWDGNSRKTKSRDIMENDEKN